MATVRERAHGRIPYFRARGVPSAPRCARRGTRGYARETRVRSRPHTRDTRYPHPTPKDPSPPPSGERVVRTARHTLRVCTCARAIRTARPRVMRALSCASPRAREARQREIGGAPAPAREARQRGSSTTRARQRIRASAAPARIRALSLASALRAHTHTRYALRARIRTRVHAHTRVRTHADPITRALASHARARRNRSRAFCASAVPALLARPRSALPVAGGSRGSARAPDACALIARARRNRSLG